MQHPQRDGEHDTQERDYHIDTVQHAGGLSSYDHSECLDAGIAVRLDVVCVVGVQHGHGDYAYGEREHEGVGDKLSGHGIRCAEHRQDAEHDEDVQVAEGVVFKEGVEYCHQDSDSAYDQQPGAAQERDSEAGGYSDGEEYYAED